MTMCYDRGHRLTSSSHVNRYVSQNQTFTYDTAGQITSLVRTGGGAGTETFVYDTGGNRTNTNGTAYANTTNNRIVSDTIFNYYYDDEGNLIRRIALVGGQPTGWTRDFQWDQHNRLVGVIDRYGGPTAPINFHYTFRYDSFDRRVYESHHLSGTGQFFFYDGEDVAMTLPITGSASRYLHGPAVDEILAREEIGATSIPVQWVYTDHLGSVRDVVANNFVTYHMDFNAFGGLQGGNNAWYYGFTGREYDHNTGLNYHRHRWLDSWIGRWINEDPIGFLGGDANLNRYVDNEVTTFGDANGLQKQKRPPTLFEQWGGEVKGPTGDQLVRTPGPGTNDSLRQQRALLQFERDITVGLPNAAACAGDAVISGLEFMPGGGTGVELGRYIDGGSSLENVLKRLPLDLSYTDEVQKLFRVGMADPRLGFSDDADRAARAAAREAQRLASEAQKLARQKLFSDVATMSGTPAQKALAIAHGALKIPNTTCNKVPNVSGGWHIFLGRQPSPTGY